MARTVCCVVALAITITLVAAYSSPVSQISTTARDHRVGLVVPGKPMYLDKPQVFLTVPDILLGSTFIATSTDPNVFASNYKLAFNLGVPSTVYVAVDEQDAPSHPQWLQNWGLQSEKLTITDERSGFNITYSLFSKVLPAGKIELGANVQSASMPYAVIIKVLSYQSMNYTCHSPPPIS